MTSYFDAKMMPTFIEKDVILSMVRLCVKQHKDENNEKIHISYILYTINGTLYCKSS